MHNIHWHKISIFILLFIFCLKAKGQQNLPLYDLRPAHFGFGIIFGSGKLKTTLSDEFHLQDTILHIRNNGFPQVGIAGLISLKLTNHLDFRFAPGLTLAQRNMDFVFPDRTDNVVIETVSFDLPFLFKYKSDRIKNTRFYVVGGLRYSFDYQSDELTERGPFKQLVPLKKQQLSYEFGVGLDIYTDYFKFSPEIKMSNGLNNVLSKDEYIYTGAFDGIFTRLFNVTMFFE